MRQFACDRCGQAVAFDAQRCTTCDAELGYSPDQLTVRRIEPLDTPATYALDGSAGAWWRCMNAAWGCNWMLPAATADVWCRSCRLTRGRPDEGRPDAIAAWMTAESAKRHLIHQIDTLALPLDARSPAIPNGLAFDLVHLPGEGAITGHLSGVVTLDLAETDDLHRHRMREQLDEQFRTVIGHLRHEIGHHYWNRLIGQSDRLSEFRRLFGDERVAYAEAIADHYATGTASWDPAEHITAYAAAHPLEDWAETFAHYLHILDTLDTAEAHDLGGAGSPLDPATVEIEAVLERWRPMMSGVNAVADALGAPLVYPFDPSGRVVAKLGYIHRQVMSHSARGRFYASH